MAMTRSTRMMLGRAAAEERRLPGRKMEIEYERWGEPEDRYDREPRGNWREPVRMTNDEPESRYRRGPRMTNDEPESRYRTGPNMGYNEPESRFRDRRGRERYNNGRYAPMRSEYRPDYDGPFGRDERGGDEMRPIGFAANWGTEMRMGSDASMPRYNEMERMPGNRPMMGGYMAGEEEYPKMDERTAMEWVQSMHNEDGSKSPHWTMDQVKQVMKQKSIDLEPAELFAIMNAIYADYDPVFKKHGVSNIDMYVDMSKAWLKDKDAVPNKARAYYECIVKR